MESEEGMALLVGPSGSMRLQCVGCHLTVGCLVVCWVVGGDTVMANQRWQCSRGVPWGSGIVGGVFLIGKLVVWWLVAGDNFCNDGRS